MIETGAPTEGAILSSTKSVSVSEEKVFEVVFICTGNRARSPLAEGLFRHHAGALPARASSFGTLDVGSLPALPDAVESGRRLGVDLSEHRSRALHRVDLSATDLVLGFELSHVSAAVVDGGADPARCFLLAEFALVAGASAFDQDPVVRARAAVEAASSHRHELLRDPAALVLADPLGKGAQVMDRTASEIDLLVREVVTRLFGGG